MSLRVRDRGKRIPVSKTFTDKQKLRLPDEGYILEYVGEMLSGYCIKNGEIVYNSPEFHGFGWHHLTWTCCPTRKRVAGKDPDYPAIFEHFKTHEEMVAKHPELAANFPKAPNDF